MSIIQQVVAGNRQAFNQLVIAYQGLAYSVAYRILQRKDLVADAVQAAFLKAYRALLTLRGEHFKSWLIRIVVNVCYDLLRACRRQATVSLDALSIAAECVRSLTDPAECPEAYVERMELRQRIAIGLRVLPPEQQAAVVL